MTQAQCWRKKNFRTTSNILPIEEKNEKYKWYGARSGGQRLSAQSNETNIDSRTGWLMNARK